MVTLAVTLGDTNFPPPQKKTTQISTFGIAFLPFISL